MKIIRQKNFGIISKLGQAAGGAVGLMGAGTAASGIGIMKLGSFLQKNPVATGIGAAALLGHGLRKLIKRRRARRAQESSYPEE